MRIDGRTPDEPRKVKIETDFVRTADGSCLIATGNTRVICTASVEDTVPPFPERQGTRLGHGGIRHAACLHRRTEKA